MKHLLAVCLAIPFVLLPVLAEEPAGKVISPVLQPFVDSNSLAGAVALVADKDKVLALEAVGFADIKGKKPMKTDAIFWIASMTKPITATALMILVDEGKVKLDDPIEKYLPEFKDLWVAVEQDKEHVLLKKPKSSVTIRQVLSHTSGMPFVSGMESPYLDQLSIRDAVRSYAITPLKTEPGTKYAYSNAGINTAGRIIEVVSGMSYEDFLQKRIFDPLGMKDSTFWPTEQQSARIALTYKPNKEKNGLESMPIAVFQHPLTDRKRHPLPGGGLFSTASDIGRFCQMLLNGGTLDGKRIVTESAVKEMAIKQTGDALKDNYGLGWAVTPDGFGHGGAYATNMTIDTKRGLVLVWMVQSAGGYPGDGGKAFPTFTKTAQDKFGTGK